MTLALLCYSKGPSAFCQQNFKTALTLEHFCGLHSVGFFAFFHKVSHHLDPEIRKALVRGLYGNENSTCDSGQ